MRRCLVVCYRPFNTYCCSYFRRLMTHEAETIGCEETSGTN